MQTSHKVLVIALVVIAAGLGLAVYNRNHPGTLKRVDNTTNTGNTNNTGTGDQTQPNGQDTTQTDTSVHIDYNNLTAAQKTLLFNVPTEKSTDAEKRAHFALATQVAVAADTLELNKCTANPVVISVKQGDTFKVKNSGTQDIQFGFDADKRVSIAAGATATIKADFKNGLGIYGYGCPDPTITHPIGFVLVEPAS